jgi:hypothetical protein
MSLLRELQEWITRELEGYTDDSEVSAYRQGVERVVRGDFMNRFWRYTGQQVPQAALPPQSARRSARSSALCLRGMTSSGLARPINQRHAL